jgi:phthalate 4,5-dioxygenase reductase component
MTAVDVVEALSLVVTETSEIAEGICRLELRRPDGRDVPGFKSGAHLRVRGPNGLTRRYPLCNDPAERHRYVVAVRRECAAQGGSISPMDPATVGTRLQCSLPRNTFPLNERASNFLFIAGGIGIAPILSMIHHLRTTGKSDFKLYYCTRSPEATAFREELGATEYGGHVVIHHDYGDPERSLDLWPLLERPTVAQLYCCGPRPMLEAIRDMTGHWSTAAVHFESIDDITETRTAADHAFCVHLARSGRIIDVAADQSILEALRAAGVEVQSSCESGTCGTCRTRLIGGDPDHRDLVLTDDERVDHIMVCVSRARSDELVIDR